MSCVPDLTVPICSFNQEHELRRLLLYMSLHLEYYFLAPHIAT